MNIDPQAPDAPIIHLLQLRHTPLLVDMNAAQLAEHIARIKQLASQPVSLAAELKSESDKVKPRNPVTAKRRALIDSL